MKFIFDNGIYKIARVTGPQNNFFGICLNKIDGEICIEALPIKEGERN